MGFLCENLFSKRAVIAHQRALLANAGVLRKEGHCFMIQIFFLKIKLLEEQMQINLALRSLSYGV